MSEKIKAKLVELTPKQLKRQRTNKRKAVNYDDLEPEMCQNCKHFARSLFSNGTSEYFPPRCTKHTFQVKPFAICDDWSDFNE